jgi:tRNA modification GTPase
MEDTIVAISTPIGEGGIGIVRLSGKQALPIADQLFTAKSKLKPSQAESFKVHYGWVVSPFGTEIVDEALLTVMRSPRSYTKEDMVEVSCHGGLRALKTVLSLATTLGARLAEPGEFTKRAFLNGRIDLTQAEAVLDIIQAKTDVFLRVSTRQLKGELSSELESIREKLMEIYVEIEAIVNFPEDEIDASGRSPLLKKIESAQQKVEHLLASSEHGRILKDGIKIVIGGKPNVGKSSLLNVLLKQPRAIVTDIAGTTRDTIEETVQIKGIPFQLVDTAGLLEPRDLIEEEAVNRSRLYIEQADLVLMVLDGHRTLSREDELLMENMKNRHVLVVINKCDLPLKINREKIRELLKGKKILKVSAKEKTGIVELEEALVESVWQGAHVSTDGVLVSNIRHINALKDCQQSLEKSCRIVQDGLSFEFVSEEIKTAVNFLDSITGRNIDSDLLENIFSQFCIGK